MNKINNSKEWLLKLASKVNLGSSIEEDAQKVFNFIKPDKKLPKKFLDLTTSSRSKDDAEDRIRHYLVQNSILKDILQQVKKREVSHLQLQEQLKEKLKIYRERKAYKEQKIYEEEKIQKEYNELKKRHSSQLRQTQKQFDIYKQKVKRNFDMHKFHFNKQKETLEKLSKQLEAAKQFLDSYQKGKLEKESNNLEIQGYIEKIKKLEELNRKWMDSDSNIQKAEKRNALLVEANRQLNEKKIHLEALNKKTAESFQKKNLLLKKENAKLKHNLAQYLSRKNHNDLELQKKLKTVKKNFQSSMKEREHIHANLKNNIKTTHKDYKNMLLKFSQLKECSSEILKKTQKKSDALMKKNNKLKTQIEFNQTLTKEMQSELENLKQKNTALQKLNKKISSKMLAYRKDSLTSSRSAYTKPMNTNSNQKKPLNKILNEIYVGLKK